MKVLLKRFHLDGHSIHRMLLSVFHCITYEGAYIAGVASVFVRFRNKERGTRVKDRTEMGRVKERGGGGSRCQNQKSRPFHVVPRIGLAPKPDGNASYADSAYKVLVSVLFTCTLQPQQQFPNVFLQRCTGACTVR